MANADEPAGRRPLTSRGSAWAAGLSRLLVRQRVSPNTISVFSVLFSIAAGGLLLGCAGHQLHPLWLLAAAACIQMRLICNLMDGMVAIEGGRKTPTGELFNEVPDRFADAVILVALGACASTQPWGLQLGWLAASLALITACIRIQGALLTGTHEFAGPMAKPQRMALATGLCIVTALLPGGFDWIFWGLVIMSAGAFVTVWRRLARIAACLKTHP